MAAFWIGFVITLLFEAMMAYSAYIIYYYGRRLAISLRVYWLGIGQFIWDSVMVGMGMWLMVLTIIGLIDILFSGGRAMAKKQRQFEVEVHAEAVPDDDMTQMIIRALFGKGPAEVAKDFLDQQAAKEVVS